MKIITKFLILWAVSVSILTIIFRTSMSYVITNELYNLTWPIAIIFAVSLFILGWFLGKRHSINIFTYGSGLHFHITDYICFGIISELWIYFGLSANSEEQITHNVLIFWGVGLLAHILIFIMKRKFNTIKGVDKLEIFD